MLKIHERLNAAQWSAANPVRPELFAASAQTRQLAAMNSIALDLDVNVRYPSMHRSKSVPLPVAAYYLADDVVAFARDNLHDVNIAVVSDRPLVIPLSDLYEVATAGWYETEKIRADEYNPGKYDFSNMGWYEDYSGTKLIEADGQIFRAPRTFNQGFDTVIDGLTYNSEYTSTALVWSVACYGLQTGALDVLRAVKRAVTSNGNS